jgi:beta-aspartyl-dipeptidase (metallo-type)
MAFLMKHATVYAPQYLGAKDVLVVGKQVVAVKDNLTVSLPELETVDAKGLVLTPGLIDQHIHVIGGGGEGGPVSRTPELMLSELVTCGTTSLVGVLGTDSVTRSVQALLAKVRALTQEGVSAWMHTSNYALPPSLLTGSIRTDLFYLPEVLGMKIAMGDHRSSYPTMDEFMRIISDIRVGGMIAGKTGFLIVHLGNLPQAFEMFDEAMDRGIPIKHIRPTHCGRTSQVFENALMFARKGGIIDITSGGSSFATPAKTVQMAMDEGINPANIVMSTDGHGSCPRFNDKGDMVGLSTGSVSSNLREFRSLLSMGVKPEQALPVITSNVATALGLADRGFVKTGGSADLCMFDTGFNLKHVMAQGRFLMRDGAVVVKGTFEE